MADDTSTSTETTETTEETEMSDSKSIEEELKQICDSRDYHIIVNQKGECIIMSPDVPSKPDFIVKPWMMKKDSFKYIVNLDDGSSSSKFQTVGISVSTVAKIRYKNGVAVIRNPELYEMYGEMNVIKKSKPAMHRAEAEAYGRTLLAESIRDSAISVEFEMLLTGEVYPGRWIKVTNPKTDIAEIFWVDTITLNLNPTDIYSMTVKCLYMPKTPQVSGGSGSADLSSLDAIGQKIATFGYCSSCQTAECMEKTGCGDCWAMADWIYKKCTAAGIKAKIVQYPTSASQRHRSVQINTGSGWEDFPYSKYPGINKNFKAYSGSRTGKAIL